MNRFLKSQARTVRSSLQGDQPAAATRSAMPRVEDLEVRLALSNNWLRSFLFAYAASRISRPPTPAPAKVAPAPAPYAQTAAPVFNLSNTGYIPVSPPPLFSGISASSSVLTRDSEQAINALARALGNTPAQTLTDPSGLPGGLRW